MLALGDKEADSDALGDRDGDSEDDTDLLAEALGLNEAEGERDLLADFEALLDADALSLDIPSRIILPLSSLSR